MIAAEAGRPECAFGCGRDRHASGVEPPEVAVVGLDRRRRQRTRDPVRREQALPGPHTVALHQQAEAGEIAGVDDHPATEVAAAGHRLHAQAVQGDPRVPVALPAPGRRRADGIHHPTLEHLRRGLALQLEQGQRQQVHAHVVVLVARAGGVQRTVRRIVAFRPVGPVVDVPQRAAPVRGLLQ